MSSSVNQRDSFTDVENSEIGTPHEAGCLKNAESSDFQSSGIIFNTPKIGAEPRDENECQSEKNILSLSVKQEISKRQTDDIEGLEDKTSDCTLLLDGHSTRSNGEGCFENENGFQVDEMVQPQVQVDVGSTQFSKNTEEKFSQILDSSEDPQHNMERRASNVQPEILLRPLSLCSESSRSGSHIEEGFVTISHPSFRFGKTMGSQKHFSPTAEHGRSQFFTDPHSREYFEKSTDTRQHSSPTAEHSRVEFVADSFSSANFIEPVGEHSSPTAEHSRADLGIDPSSIQSFKEPISSIKHSIPTAQEGKVETGTNSSSSIHCIKQSGLTEHSSPTVEHGRAELGIDPPGSVRFIKPTGTRQKASPKSKRGTENRDIFESTGEPLRNLPEGASYSGPGLEDIEKLSLRESPEPQIVISPASSDEPHVNCWQLVKVFFWRLMGFLKVKTCRQFGKAPLFYLFSTLVIMICTIAADSFGRDRDIPLAIIIAFLLFILITFVVDRGQFSHILDSFKSCIPECRRACRNSDTCIQCCCYCCCKSTPEPSLERHSQYRHLEEDGAFRHEIADVSRLDPKDCPRIKMVELRGSEHEESPDYPPEISQVNADVHVVKREGERLGATRKIPAQKAKPHKTQSDRSRPGPTKTFRADIHAPSELSSPELSPIQETALNDGIQNGEDQSTNSDVCGTRPKEARKTSRNDMEDASANDEDFGENESMKSKKKSQRFSGGDDFKRFSECSPTLPRFPKIRQSDHLQAGSGGSTSPEDESIPVVDIAEDSPDAVEFMCEHYGQGVACSCPALLER